MEEMHSKGWAKEKENGEEEKVQKGLYAGFSKNLPQNPHDCKLLMFPSSVLDTYCHWT